MKGMTLKENIIQLAHSIGISKIGFTTADDFAYLEKSLRLAVEEGRNSGFEHKNIEERIQPKLSLSSAKTIISIAVAYPHKLKQRTSKTAYKRGKFTPNSWGLDYHYVLQDKLNRLAAGIEEMTQDLEYKGMVDTGALVDTAVAQRAGIGFIGKMAWSFQRIRFLHVSGRIDYQPRNRTGSASRLWLWRLSTLFRCMPNLLFNRRWLYECQALFVLPNPRQGHDGPRISQEN